MEPLILVLLLVTAAVCFALAAVRFASRVNLVPLGLLCWVITAIVPMLYRV